MLILSTLLFKFSHPVLGELVLVWAVITFFWVVLLAIKSGIEAKKDETHANKNERLSEMNITWPGTIVYFRTKIGQKKSPDYIKLSEKFVAEFDSRNNQF